MVTNVYTFQTACYTSTSLISLLVIVIDTTHFTIIKFINYVCLSLVAFPVFLAFWDEISNTFIRHTAQDTYLTIHFLAMTSLVISLMILPFYLVTLHRFIFSPDLLQRT